MCVYVCVRVFISSHSYEILTIILFYLRERKMLLGLLIVNFLWSVLSSLEDAGKDDQAVVAQRKFHNLEDSTSSDIVGYALPALWAWIQLVGIIPHSYGNYSCVFYTVMVIFQISRYGFQQYSQHCLFCLLFMALGLFL